MDWHGYLGICLMLIATFSNSLYIIDTLKGKTKPNRVSYALWFIALLFGGLASLTNEISWATIMVLYSAGMCLIILLSSFVNKNAYWKIRKLDCICGTFAIIAMVCWLAFEDPITTLVFCILTDFLTTIPVLAKCYKHPETETKISYLLYFSVVSLSLFNVLNWSSIESVFPSYQVFINGAMLVCVYWSSVGPRLIKTIRRPK